jgi:hypothetical protein
MIFGALLLFQDAVYEVTSRSLVSDVLRGYNGAVFAYGATGCGKTHTMVGSPQQPGIMFRALSDLFQAVKDSSNPECFTVGSEYELTAKLSLRLTKNHTMKISRKDEV